MVFAVELRSLSFYFLCTSFVLGVRGMHCIFECVVIGMHLLVSRMETSLENAASRERPPKNTAAGTDYAKTWLEIIRSLAFSSVIRVSGLPLAFTLQM